MLDRSGDPAPVTTRVTAVVAEIQARIASRRLAPGARLPSVRELADRMEVSKSTVVDAYDRLVATGAVTARRGSGFFVAGARRPLSLQSLSPDLDRAIDPLWMSRLSFGTGPHVLKPGSGLLPASYMPDLALQKALRQAARDPAAESRTAYDDPLGFPPLRRQLALRIAGRGTEIEPDDILLTDSTSTSIDLVLRFLIEPGDAVLVDDPCYFNFLAMLLSHRAKVVGVPYGPDGPDVDAFGRAVAAHRPRVYLTTAGLHNPTGGTLSAVKAHRMLKLAEAHDVVVIEDDTFADLDAEAAPRLADFDGLDRVIRVGSHSKTVSSAIRCGFLAARPEWLTALVDIKLSTSLGNGHLPAVVVHHVLTEGGYRRHVEGLRAKLGRDMGLTLKRLKALGLRPSIEPRAGLFVWAELPDGLDAADVTRAALADDVLLAPGNVFSAGHRFPGHLRFNVARCADPRVFEVLGRVLREARR